VLPREDVLPGKLGTSDSSRYGELWGFNKMRRYSLNMAKYGLQIPQMGNEKSTTKSDEFHQQTSAEPGFSLASQIPRNSSSVMGVFFSR